MKKLMITLVIVVLFGLLSACSPEGENSDVSLLKEIAETEEKFKLATLAPAVCNAIDTPKVVVDDGFVGYFMFWNEQKTFLNPKDADKGGIGHALQSNIEINPGEIWVVYAGGDRGTWKYSGKNLWIRIVDGGKSGWAIADGIFCDPIPLDE